VGLLPVDVGQKLLLTWRYGNNAQNMTIPWLGYRRLDEEDGTDMSDFVVN